MAPKINPEWTKEVNNATSGLKGDMESRMIKLKEQMMGFMAKMDTYMGKRPEQPKLESNLEESSESKGLRQCYLPKVEIQKFDGKDVRIWLSQME